MKENRVYKMAIAELENEAYDMQEEYSNEDIADAVQQIVAKLNKEGDDVEVDLDGSAVKVRNNDGWSFVSFTTGEYTGLSEASAEITDLSKPIDEFEVKKLIGMINEAWYHAVS